MSNRLALGTVQFGLPYGIANQGGQVTSSEACKIISCARENEIMTIDTAMAYGESEKILGHAGVKDFEVISKLPEIPLNVLDVDDWVMKQVAGSLEKLGISKLHGLLLHQPMQLVSKQGKALVAALNRVRDEGLSQKIGVSIYSSEELSGVMEILDVQIVQAPFNLIDRQMLTSGWMDRLHDADIEIHARSIFLQGLLLIQNSKIRKKFQRWNNIWDKWDKWLVEKTLTPVKACLGFVESFPQIKKLVVGVDSLAHLRELIENSDSSSNVMFPDIECNDIDLINPSRWKIA
jgi:aryl-alcohol dehydrogenase-like predicted oxidoreductase